MATSTKEMMKLLAQMHLNSYSETTTITYENGKKIIVTQRSGIHNNIWESNGYRYSLDDPTAANCMSGKDREQLWAICDDKAKDSELYRKYALERLAIAKIDLEDLYYPELKLLVM
ncbi:hypothetical protein TUM19329_15150 [Legionella antarctica]|uniref:Uncharacterized protein n=1 Tax=Legionella antarctica TaxID=2708020 RepID=A0A6F8T392_9GAMM|nr:hypothetical protein [Legionella antarctica]BCA95154.1 hypothetical protein TUM19329_15150 [Legionella antarctica]